MLWYAPLLAMSLSCAPVARDPAGRVSTVPHQEVSTNHVVLALLGGEPAFLYWDDKSPVLIGNRTGTILTQTTKGQWRQDAGPWSVTAYARAPAKLPTDPGDLLVQAGSSGGCVYQRHPKAPVWLCVGCPGKVGLSSGFLLLDGEPFMIGAVNHGQMSLWNATDSEQKINLPVPRIKAEAVDQVVHYGGATWVAFSSSSQMVGLKFDPSGQAETIGTCDDSMWGTLHPELHRIICHGQIRKDLLAQGIPARGIIDAIDASGTTTRFAVVELETERHALLAESNGKWVEVELSNFVGAATARKKLLPARLVSIGLETHVLLAVSDYEVPDAMLLVNLEARTGRPACFVGFAPCDARTTDAL